MGQSPSPFLHLHQAPHAEEMPAIQMYWFEHDAHAYQARVVEWYDGEEGLAEIV